LKKRNVNNAATRSTFASICGLPPLSDWNASVETGGVLLVVNHTLQLVSARIMLLSYRMPRILDAAAAVAGDDVLVSQRGVVVLWRRERVEEVTDERMVTENKRTINVFDT